MELAGGASHFSLLAAVSAADAVSATITPSETRVRGIDLAGEDCTWSSTLPSAETHWASTYSYGELAADRQEVTNLRLPGQYDERLFAAAGIAGLQGPYYNWNRWYLPSVGRYMELDPMALRGGFNSTYGIDWYNYAQGNPLTRSDPTGLWPFEGCPGCMDTCCCSEVKNPGSCPNAAYPDGSPVKPGIRPEPPKPPPTCETQPPKQPIQPDPYRPDPLNEPGITFGTCAAVCSRYPSAVWPFCMAICLVGGLGSGPL